MIDYGVDLTSWMCRDIEKYTGYHCPANVLDMNMAEEVIDGLLTKIEELQDEIEEMKERDK